MSNSKPSILFISHDANRAGAQLMLLRWLRLFQKENCFKINILLKHGGVLQPDFEAIAPAQVWFSTESDKRTLGQKVLNKLGIQTSTRNEKLKQWLQIQNIDLVVSNTLTNGELVESLAFLNCPVITYVHELEEHLNMYTNPTALEKALRLTKHFLVCSKTAGKHLVQRYGVDPRAVTWLPSLLEDLPARFEEASALLPNLLTSKDTGLVCGGIGTADRRKGIDMFVQLAELLPNDSLVWVGASADDFKQVLGRDTLPPNLVCIPSTPEVLRYLKAFDMLLLTSRAEVYPMVAMEALYAQVPVVYFSDGGSTIELVEQDAGIGVPDFSVEGMKSAIERLRQAPDLRKQMGQVGKQKILQRHQDAASLATFVEIVQKNL